MNKAIIILGAILLILGIGAYFVLAPGKVEKAILYIEQGEVQVDRGDGFVAATDEMILKEGASVRTKTGKATIVLLEGELMHLEQNTEVTIEGVSKDKISLAQAAGETWNKITKISGVREFEVTTPNTVATVRGTEFFLTDDELEVAEGEVKYLNKETKQTLLLAAGKMADHESMQAQDIPRERLLRHERFRKLYVEILRKVRTREIRKHKTILGVAEDKGYSEDTIQERLKRADEGLEDIDAAYQEVPSALRPKAKRTYQITKAIKEAKEAPALTEEERQSIEQEITETTTTQTEEMSETTETTKDTSATVSQITG